MIQIKKISNFYPILIVKNFYPLDKNMKENVIKTIMKNREKNFYNPKINFSITDDDDNFFKNLYEEFIFLSEKIFGNLTYLESNTSKCHCYVTNNNGYGSNYYHDHIDTSTLNGVYYLNIPQTTLINSGSITFNHRGRTVTYKPHNYDLLIFPNYLEHKVNFSNHHEDRISVNMEILCKENPDKLFKRCLSNM